VLPVLEGGCSLVTSSFAPFLSDNFWVWRVGLLKWVVSHYFRRLSEVLYCTVLYVAVARQRQPSSSPSSGHIKAMDSDESAAVAPTPNVEPAPGDAVLHALQSARYNELVHLEVADGDEAREVCLVACLDERNGGIVWNPIPDAHVAAAASSAETKAKADPGADDESSAESTADRRIQRHLRTKRWVLPMLNDHRRNELYQRAIARAVDHDARRLDETSSPPGENGEENIEVSALDIGSGSGLLSMMAAQSVLDLNKSRQTACDSPPSCLSPSVVSVEMSSAMADLARLIVRDNELDGHIQVFNAHSSELVMPHDRRADLCVSELLESGLLGEGLLPSMRDAWTRLLKPDATTVPHSARVYAAAVQSGIDPTSDDDNQDVNWISRYHPSALCQQVDGVAWKALLEDAGGEASGAVVVPVHAAKLLRDKRLALLTEPACVLTIPLDKDPIPCERGQKQQVSMPVTSSGAVQGFLVWWELDLWQSGNPRVPSITYSMDPRDDTVTFQDHWQQCLHVLSNPTTVLRGETISMLASHNDSSIQLEVMASALNDESPRKRSRHEQSQPTFRACSSERVYQLTDRTRSQFYRSAIVHAVSSFSAERTDLHVLDLSDFGHCGILAALHGACAKVTSVESAGRTTAEWTSRVAQASNLPKTCQFEILACHAEQLDRTALGGGTPNVVIAEPYYQVLEGWHLQEALNYYYLVRSLRRRSVLQPDTIAIPGVCRVMACGIESRELRAVYGPCGEGESSSVCGFDHGAVNRNGCFGQHTLSLPLWQYDYRRLTDEVEIGRLDYMSPHEGSIRSSSTLDVQESGTLDAIMIWLEYGYGCGISETESSLRLSTNAQSYRQGLRLLKKPVHVAHNAKPNDVVHVDFAMGGLNGSDDHVIDVHVGIREDSADK
jgi:type III protein arginine methyltransferase